MGKSAQMQWTGSLPAGGGKGRRGLLSGGGLFLLLLPILLLATSVEAQTTATPAPTPRASHPEAARAISELKSPYCPGLMLEVCPSPQAALLRDSIQMLAEGGMGSRALVEWMIGNHGEIYRAVPLTRGTGLWAWLGPPIALLLGVVGLIFAYLRLLRRRTHAPAASPAPRRAVSDAERERVRAALREMEALEEPIL